MVDSVEVRLVLVLVLQIKHPIILAEVGEELVETAQILEILEVPIHLLEELE